MCARLTHDLFAIAKFLVMFRLTAVYFDADVFCMFSVVVCDSSVDFVFRDANPPVFARRLPFLHLKYGILFGI